MNAADRTEEHDPARLYAWLYDAGDVGWAGELDFYREIARASHGTRMGVLDVGCGTGRIALALAADGFPVTGADTSPSMIEVARSKTDGDNPAWVVSDMRRLDLGREFGCVIVGGHAFQFMTGLGDAETALRAMRRRLTATGRIVLHLDNPDPTWLRGLPEVPGRQAPAGAPRTHGLTGERWQMTSHWSLDRDRRDAVLTWAWQKIGPGDRVETIVAQPPLRLHVFTPSEVGLAMTASGLETEAVYGDFDRSPFTTEAPSLIWVAHQP